MSSLVLSVVVNPFYVSTFCNGLPSVLSVVLQLIWQNIVASVCGLVLEGLLLPDVCPLYQRRNAECVLLRYAFCAGFMWCCSSTLYTFVCQEAFSQFRSACSWRAGCVVLPFGLVVALFLLVTSGVV